jgi:hypothetical protein
MLEHAKHFGTLPNVAPLDPANFQNPRSQRVARFNDLFSSILFTRRSQFLHKDSAIVGLVEELDSALASTLEDLPDGDSRQRQRDWEFLDAIHFDLNTCFREAVVLLKSFLHALPDGQLESFEAILKTQSSGSRPSLRTRVRHLARRRMAFLKGQ